MKLTVDCDSSGPLFASPPSMLTYLLSKASVTYADLPLEALVCEQHHLLPAPDYPIAAIAASADGLTVGDAYWLRADPVHLLLQRDSFSLSEPCPLSVSPAHAEAIMQSLNQHFEQDGLKFCLGNSGAWYLRLAQAPNIKTSLPATVIGQNVAHHMPQGAAAKVWVSYLNEVQMLLHGHAANTERELAGDVVINSIWLSSGGVMPALLNTTSVSTSDYLIGSKVFYQGLAQLSGVEYQELSLSVQDHVSQLTKQSHVRLQLPAQRLFEEQTLLALLNALKTRKISQLVINLACYEKTLVATINTLDLYKFWRKSKPLSAYLT